MLSSQHHRIRIHRRATRVGAFEVFEAAHVALRTLLAFSQPVNCIFWPIGMLNWLVAASKLHKHRVTCCTAEWPFYSFLILCPTPFIYLRTQHVSLHACKISCKCIGKFVFHLNHIVTYPSILFCIESNFVCTLYCPRSTVF